MFYSGPFVLPGLDVVVEESYEHASLQPLPLLPPQQVPGPAAVQQPGVPPPPYLLHRRPMACWLLFMQLSVVSKVLVSCQATAGAPATAASKSVRAILEMEDSEVVRGEG